MLPPGLSDVILINRPGQARLSRLDGEGSVHAVEVLSRLDGNRARISVDGAEFTARLPADYADGSRFRASLRRVDGLLTLVPIASAPDRGDGASRRSLALTGLAALAERLSLPQTPAVLSLISFYSGLGMRLEPPLIRRLAAAASRFPGKEEDAAEAAAMLDRAGIPADDGRIETLAAILRGDSEGGAQGGSKDSDGDILDKLNGREGDSQWVIIPFSRVAGSGYSGSLRFLWAPQSGSVWGMRIGAVIDGRSVLVEWGDEIPTFSVNPPVVSVILEKTKVYFNNALTEAGIKPIEFAKSPGFDFSPVDVKA